MWFCNIGSRNAIIIIETILKVNAIQIAKTLKKELYWFKWLAAKIKEKI